MKNKIQLTCYSNIIDDPDNLKGVLPDARIEEIKSWVAPGAFQEVKLENQRLITSHYINDPTGSLFAKQNWDNESSLAYIKRNIISDLLTEEEIIKINKIANAEHTARQTKARFEKAEKIVTADYKGDWVYREGVGYNEGYFESIYDFKDFIESEWDDDEAAPEYVWACAEKPVVNLSIDSILDNVYDNAYEDFETDNLTGVEELTAALEKFNKLNKDVVSYYPDYTTVILL